MTGIAGIPGGKPLLLYDGDCSFCRAGIARWRPYTGGAVAYVPYQQALDRFPDIPRTALAEAVHLVEPDGKVTRAAEALFRALELGGRPFGARCYRRSALFRWGTEAGYRWVARHRGFLVRFIRRKGEDG